MPFVRSSPTGPREGTGRSKETLAPRCLCKSGSSEDSPSLHLGLLSGAEKEERHTWVEFMRFLFSCEHVNLDGKNNDALVKLKISKANYTDAATSLSIDYRRPRRMRFRDLR